MGASAPVTVSPTRVSWTVLMEAVIYPTSPAESSASGFREVAPMEPTSTTPNSAPVAIIRMVMPGFTEPSITRT